MISLKFAHQLISNITNKEESYMYKLIIVSCLVILLTACGNDKDLHKLPKECQEIFDVVELFNLELDTNPYVPTDLAENRKKYLKLTTKGYKKGPITSDRQLKNCKTMADVLKMQLKYLKEAKSEKDVKKVILWVRGLD